ncbi:MAG: hypothetical protein H6757_00265 [Candidatus Omnitrophica bacterium]|nr:hypothetical protein [Candidatus Omnitrophota bacterium]
MKQKSFQKIIATLTAVTFIFTSHVTAPALAQTPVLEMSLPGTFADDFSQVELPESMGVVEEAYLKGRDRTVILIQDAHSVPGAQRNIQKLIRYFGREYGIGLVALEGVDAQFDLQIFKSFPDKSKLKYVLKNLHDQGELSGPAAAALFNDEVQTFRGVENWGLYEEGLGYYLSARRHEEEIARNLQGWQDDLQSRKEKTYSKILLETDTKIENFQQNKIEFVDLLNYLTPLKAPVEGTAIAVLAGQMHEAFEQNLAIETETEALALKVKQHLEKQNASQNDLSRFNQEEQLYQTSQITNGEFTLFLKELVDEYQIACKVSDKLNRQAQGHQKLRDLEGSKLSEDLDEYIHAVKESLFRNQEERNLDGESRRLFLMKKLIRLELSRSEWRELEGEMDYALWTNFKDHIAFYQNARKRDEAMMKRLTSEMDHLQSGSKLPPAAGLRRAGKTAIMIAGGFHTQGLTEQFRQKGISYLLVRPKIEKLPEENLYRKQMSGDLSWKNYFKVQNGRVNLYDAFVRAERDKLLNRTEKKELNRSELSPHRSVLAKRWRDQIIRDLADRDELAKAGQYTQYLDELNDQGQGVRDEGLKSWVMRLRGFIDGLRKLDAAGQVTEQNILNLLNVQNTPVGAVVAWPSRTATLPADLVGIKQTAVSTRVKEPPQIRSSESASQDTLHASRTELRTLQDRIRAIGQIDPFLSDKEIRKKFKEILDSMDGIDLPPTYSQDETIELLQQKTPLIVGTQLLENVSAIQTPWGIVDLRRLNNLDSFDREDGAMELAMHLEIAHSLGLIQIKMTNFLQGVSAQGLYKKLKSHFKGSPALSWMHDQTIKIWSRAMADGRTLRGRVKSEDGKLKIVALRWEDGHFYLKEDQAGEIKLEDTNEAQIYFYELLGIVNYGNGFRALPAELKNTKKGGDGPFGWSLLALNGKQVLEIRKKARALELGETLKGPVDLGDGEVEIELRRDVASGRFYVREGDTKERELEDTNEAQIYFYELLGITHYGVGFSAMPAKLKNTKKGGEGLFGWSKMGLSGKPVREVRKKARTLETKESVEGTVDLGNGEVKIKLRWDGESFYVKEGDEEERKLEDANEAQIYFYELSGIIHYGKGFRAVPANLVNLKNRGVGLFDWSGMNLSGKQVRELRKKARALEAGEALRGTVDLGEGEAEIELRWDVASRKFYVKEGDAAERELEDTDEAQIYFYELLGITHYGNGLSAIPADLKNTKKGGVGLFGWSKMSLSGKQVRELRKKARALEARESVEGIVDLGEGEATIKLRWDGRSFYVKEGDGEERKLEDTDEAQIYFYELLGIAHYGNSLSAIPADLKNTKKGGVGLFGWSWMNLSGKQVRELRKKARSLEAKESVEGTVDLGEGEVGIKLRWDGGNFYVKEGDGEEKKLEDTDEAQIYFYELIGIVNYGSGFSAIPANLRNTTNRGVGLFGWSQMNLSGKQVGELREKARVLEGKESIEGIVNFGEGEVGIKLRWDGRSFHVKEGEGEERKLEDTDEAQIYFYELLGIVNYGNGFSAIPAKLKNTTKGGEGTFSWSFMNLSGKQAREIRKKARLLADEKIFSGKITDEEETIEVNLRYDAALNQFYHNDSSINPLEAYDLFLEMLNIRGRSKDTSVKVLPYPPHAAIDTRVMFGLKRSELRSHAEIVKELSGAMDDGRLKLFFVKDFNEPADYETLMQVLRQGGRFSSPAVPLGIPVSVEAARTTIREFLSEWQHKSAEWQISADEPAFLSAGVDQEIYDWAHNALYSASKAVEYLFEKTQGQGQKMPNSEIQDLMGVLPDFYQTMRMVFLTADKTGAGVAVIEPETPDARVAEAPAAESSYLRELAKYIFHITAIIKDENGFRFLWNLSHHFFDADIPEKIKTSTLSREFRDLLSAHLVEMQKIRPEDISEKAWVDFLIQAALDFPREKSGRTARQALIQYEGVEEVRRVIETLYEQDFGAMIGDVEFTDFLLAQWDTVDWPQSLIEGIETYETLPADSDVWADLGFQERQIPVVKRRLEALMRYLEQRRSGEFIFEPIETDDYELKSVETPAEWEFFEEHVRPRNPRLSLEPMLWSGQNLFLMEQSTGQVQAAVQLLSPSADWRQGGVRRIGRSLWVNPQLAEPKRKEVYETMIALVLKSLPQIEEEGEQLRVFLPLSTFYQDTRSETFAGHSTRDLWRSEHRRAGEQIVEVDDLDSKAIAESYRRERVYPAILSRVDEMQFVTMDVDEAEGVLGRFQTTLESHPVMQGNFAEDNYGFMRENLRRAEKMSIRLESTNQWLTMFFFPMNPDGSIGSHVFAVSEHPENDGKIAGYSFLTDNLESLSVAFDIFPDFRGQEEVNEIFYLSLGDGYRRYEHTLFQVHEESQISDSNLEDPVKLAGFYLSRGFWPDQLKDLADFYLARKIRDGTLLTEREVSGIFNHPDRGSFLSMWELEVPVKPELRFLSRSEFKKEAETYQDSFGVDIRRSELKAADFKDLHAVLEDFFERLNRYPAAQGALDRGELILDLKTDERPILISGSDANLIVVLLEEMATNAYLMAKKLNAGKPIEVRFSARYEDGHLVLEVQDNSVGIDVNEIAAQLMRLKEEQPDVMEIYWEMLDEALRMKLETGQSLEQAELLDILGTVPLSSGKKTGGIGFLLIKNLTEDRYGGTWNFETLPSQERRMIDGQNVRVPSNDSFTRVRAMIPLERIHQAEKQKEFSEKAAARIESAILPVFQSMYSVYPKEKNNPLGQAIFSAFQAVDRVYQTLNHENIAGARQTISEVFSLVDELDAVANDVTLFKEESLLFNFESDLNVLRHSILNFLALIDGLMGAPIDREDLYRPLPWWQEAANRLVNRFMPDLLKTDQLIRFAQWISTLPTEKWVYGFQDKRLQDWLSGGRDGWGLWFRRLSPDSNDFEINIQTPEGSTGTLIFDEGKGSLPFQKDGVKALKIFQTLQDLERNFLLIDRGRLGNQKSEYKDHAKEILIRLVRDLNRPLRLSYGDKNTIALFENNEPVASVRVGETMAALASWEQSNLGAYRVLRNIWEKAGDAEIVSWSKTDDSLTLDLADGRRILINQIGMTFLKSELRNQPEDFERAFEKILYRHGLTPDSLLVKFFPDAIKRALVADPALRPVLLRRLPGEQMGPPQIQDGALLEELDLFSIFQDYSVFSAGSPQTAEKLAAQGVEIIIGVTDTFSEDTLSDATYPVANNRQVYFPLKDGSWLGVKGIGQMENFYEAPHRPAVAWAQRHEGVTDFRDLEGVTSVYPDINDAWPYFRQSLGYRELKSLPDRNGNLIPVDQIETNVKSPLLIFGRVLHPHRLSKFPQLLKIDSTLQHLREELTRTFKSIGIFSEEQYPGDSVISPEDWVLESFRWMGRAEAFKQRNHIYKKTIHSQDFGMALGQENDPGELENAAVRSARLLQDRRSEGYLPEDQRRTEPFTDYVSVMGLATQVTILIEMIRVIREIAPQNEDLFLPDKERVLRELFENYFENVGEEYRALWTDSEKQDDAEKLLGFLYTQAKRRTPVHSVEAILGGQDPVQWTLEVAREAFRKSELRNETASSNQFDKILTLLQDEKFNETIQAVDELLPALTLESRQALWAENIREIAVDLESYHRVDHREYLEAIHQAIDRQRNFRSAENYAHPSAWGQWTSADIEAVLNPGADKLSALISFQHVDQFTRVMIDYARTQEGITVMTAPPLSGIDHFPSYIISRSPVAARKIRDLLERYRRLGRNPDADYALQLGLLLGYSREVILQNMDLENLHRERLAYSEVEHFWKDPRYGQLKSLIFKYTDVPGMGGLMVRLMTQYAKDSVKGKTSTHFKEIAGELFLIDDFLSRIPQAELLAFEQVLGPREIDAFVRIPEKAEIPEEYRVFKPGLYLIEGKEVPIRDLDLLWDVSLEKQVFGQLKQARLLSAIGFPVQGILVAAGGANYTAENQDVGKLRLIEQKSRIGLQNQLREQEAAVSAGETVPAVIPVFSFLSSPFHVTNDSAADSAVSPDEPRVLRWSKENPMDTLDLVRFLGASFAGAWPPSNEVRSQAFERLYRNAEDAKEKYRQMAERTRRDKNQRKIQAAIDRERRDSEIHEWTEWFLKAGIQDDALSGDYDHDRSRIESVLEVYFKAGVSLDILRNELQVHVRRLSGSAEPHTIDIRLPDQPEFQQSLISFRNFEIHAQETWEWLKEISKSSSTIRSKFKSTGGQRSTPKTGQKPSKPPKPPRAAVTGEAYLTRTAKGWLEVFQDYFTDAAEAERVLRFYFGQLGTTIPIQRSLLQTRIKRSGKEQVWQELVQAASNSDGAQDTKAELRTGTKEGEFGFFADAAQLDLSDDAQKKKLAGELAALDRVAFGFVHDLYGNTDVWYEKLNHLDDSELFVSMDANGAPLAYLLSSDNQGAIWLDRLAAPSHPGLGGFMMTSYLEYLNTKGVESIVLNPTRESLGFYLRILRRLRWRGLIREYRVSRANTVIKLNSGFSTEAQSHQPVLEHAKEMIDWEQQKLLYHDQVLLKHRDIYPVAAEHDAIVWQIETAKAAGLLGGYPPVILNFDPHHDAYENGPAPGNWKKMFDDSGQALTFTIPPVRGRSGQGGLFNKARVMEVPRVIEADNTDFFNMDEDHFESLTELKDLKIQYNGQDYTLQDYPGQIWLSLDFDFLWMFSDYHLNPQEVRQQFDFLAYYLRKNKILIDEAAGYISMTFLSSKPDVDRQAWIDQVSDHLDAFRKNIFAFGDDLEVGSGQIPTKTELRLEKRTLYENDEWNIGLLETLVSRAAHELDLEASVVGGTRYLQSGRRSDVDIALNVKGSPDSTLVKRYFEELIRQMEPYGIKDSSAKPQVDHAKRLMTTAVFQGTTELTFDLYATDSWEARAEWFLSRFELVSENIAFKRYLEMEYYLGDAETYRQALQAYQTGLTLNTRLQTDRRIGFLRQKAKTGNRQELIRQIVERSLSSISESIAAETAAQTFASELRNSDQPQSELRKASEITVRIGVSPVIEKLESILAGLEQRERMEIATLIEGRPVSTAALQNEIKKVIAQLQNLPLEGASFGYMLPEQPDDLLSFTRVIRMFGRMIRQIFIPVSNSSVNIPAELQETLKDYDIVLTRVNHLRRPVVYLTDQTYAGVVGRAEDFEGRSLEDTLMPVTLADESFENDPLMSELVLALQVAASLLVAGKVKSKADRYKLQAEAVSLLKDYELFPGFESRIIQVTESGIAVSGRQVLLYLEWAARQSVQQSA